jgi:hypothetical protein
MRVCSHCGRGVDRRFRFCPWCAEPQRRKIVEFFRAHPDLADESGSALRVSQYFGDTPPERHVRFSVWDESGRARAAVSLDEETAAQLAEFLQPRRRTLLEQLRELAQR